MHRPCGKYYVREFLFGNISQNSLKSLNTRGCVILCRYNVIMNFVRKRMTEITLSFSQNRFIDTLNKVGKETVRRRLCINT